MADGSHHMEVADGSKGGSGSLSDTFDPLALMKEGQAAKANLTGNSPDSKQMAATGAVGKPDAAVDAGCGVGKAGAVVNTNGSDGQSSKTPVQPGAHHGVVRGQQNSVEAEIGRANEATIKHDLLARSGGSEAKLKAAQAKDKAAEDKFIREEMAARGRDHIGTWF